jgi:hypothetical protein
MKTIHESRRARFLKEMLDAFDSEDSQKLMNLANDTQITFWPVCLAIDGNEQLSAMDQKVLREMEKQFKRLLGHTHSSERLRLSPSANDGLIKIFQKGLEKLSSHGKQALPDAFEMIDLGQLEVLDARYAQEILEKLKKIIARVAKLDKLPPLTIPNRSVQLAFEDAHRCYLYGFRSACTVLCRATVESALREVLEAAGYTFSDDPKFADMLKLPRAKDALGDLHGLAHEIRRAGNDAIHDVDTFDKEYPGDKIQDLLLKTRKIVEHLYAIPTR